MSSVKVLAIFDNFHLETENSSDLVFFLSLYSQITVQKIPFTWKLITTSYFFLNTLHHDQGTQCYSTSRNVIPFSMIKFLPYLQIIRKPKWTVMVKQAYQIIIVSDQITKASGYVHYSNQGDVRKRSSRFDKMGGKGAGGIEGRGKGWDQNDLDRLTHRQDS